MGLASTSRVVSVTFLGFLRHVVRAREITIALDAGATVRDLLEALARAHGARFTEAVFRAPGQVHTHLRVFVDEEEARLDDPVARGDSPAAVALLVVPGFEGGSA
jgi:hypothetical protein